ncbi:MAG TPA: transporter substrate-binding domain-containing protein [Azospirillaceae bacterium]|nr:transporter substrate-binding domain-containing protein [Azospirillaceae bacterium]
MNARLFPSRLASRLLLALSLLAPAAAAEAADRLVLLTEENAPYNFTDPATGRITGAATDLVHAMMAEAGMEAELQLTSWARAYNQVLSTPGSCLFAANRTPEREHQFTWVPLLRRGGGWVIYTEADSPLSLDSLEAARGQPILTIGGGPLEAFLKAQGLDVIAVKQDAIFRMMGRGRATLAAMGSLAGPWRARTAGVEIRPLLVIGRNDLWLACNRSLPASLAQRLEAALSRLEAQGRVEAMLDAYR